MQIRFIASLIFAILVAIFAIQNSEIVTIDFLFAAFPVSQALVILISAALGAIIALLFGAVKHFKAQHKIKEQGRTIEQLKNELEAIKEKKQIPIVIETKKDDPLCSNDDISVE